MARESFNQITEDSDSSIGSNGDTHIPTVTVPFVGAQLEAEGSSAPVAPIKHKPSQTSKKQKGVAPPPSPPKPNETEIAASIQQPTTPLGMNSSNNPVFNAVLRAECQVAGVTYSRPYRGASKPRPLVGVTSSNLSYGRGSGAPDPVEVRSHQLHHPGAAAYSAWRYHPYVGQDHQPLRGLTVDYLSQMEAASSLVPPVQVQRENPPNEVFAQWGETLSLGNGKRVDLNLRIRLG